MIIQIMNNWQKEKYLELINWLFIVVHEGWGGDGDAIWYTKENIHDLYLLVEQYNNENNLPWKVELDNKEIHWGDNQEWIIITNDIKEYTNNNWGGPVIYF